MGRMPRRIDGELRREVIRLAARGLTYEQILERVDMKRPGSFELLAAGDVLRGVVLRIPAVLREPPNRRFPSWVR